MQGPVIQMLRGIAGLIVALAVWVIVASVGHRAVCAAWPAYAAATPLLSFSLPMMIARLALSAVATLAAGSSARALSNARWLPVTVGCVLVLIFLPMHVGIWARLPAWYHLTFLASLIPLSVVGARLVRQSRPAANCPVPL